MKGFEPWGWVIGSGVYIDTVNAAIWQRDLGFGAVALVLGTLVSRNLLRQLGGEHAALRAASRRATWRWQWPRGPATNRA